ncbi:MAG: SUMF1/EgtB/PvdO family nonheme iron enzyme [Deltaproteobacteria bacterium]|nr:SUMF1/EgtB/PvdO family nonheme iron enzyme [Deltaproteobacteria bacterium]
MLCPGTRFFLVALGLVVFPPEQALAQKPIVAVFNIDARGVKLNNRAKSILRDYIETQLTASGVYEVVPPDALRKALSKQKTKSYKACFAQSCQISIGQEVAANKSLSTRVSKIGRKCMVTAKLYDLLKSTAEKGATSEGRCGENGIMGSTKVVVARLTGKDISPKPSWAMGRDSAPMVLVPAGNFMRGSNFGNKNEKPQRSIYLDAFYIDKHEVTVRQYRKCVRDGSCSRPDIKRHCNWGKSGRDNHPINCVNWKQAKNYCSWVGNRLPTEAEWEKAARGTDGRKYPWGEAKATCTRAVMSEGGVSLGCGKSRTWAVGSKSPAGDSPYGAQDMAGNVWEWVRDGYAKDYYAVSPSRNPKGPSSRKYRVLRGGSWSYIANYLGAAYRYGFDPTSRSYVTGFRCSRPK